MKTAMNAHVDQERHVMFQESADEVRNRLKTLVQDVEETMSNRVDEVFIAMRRDYRSVLGGGDDVQGQVLPKAQRIMRKEVSGVIDGVEEIFKNMMDADNVEMEHDVSGSNKPSEAPEAADQDSDSEYFDKLEFARASGSESGDKNAHGSEHEFGEGQDNEKLEEKKSEEELQAAESDSFAQHSSPSKSGVGPSDSDSD